MRTDYDVIVVGGGPGGIGAAVGCARAGADVLLVERYGFLGGGATAMMVNPLMPFSAGDRQIIHGVLQDMIDRMTEMKSYGSGRATRSFDTEAFKIAAEQLCLESGVDILFHSFLADVENKGNAVESIGIATKDGIKRLRARIYVDSTGDGDLAYLAGARIEKGRSQDGLAQPMTLCFRMAGVDMDRMESRDKMTEEYVKAKAEGRIRCPREDILYFYVPQPGVVHFNQTRVIKHDAVDPESLTLAEIEARRQAWEISRWLVETIPGFEESYLQMSAPQIGVRESRRVIGEYLLTDEDLFSTRKFDDVIGCGSYPVDIHNPDGEGTVIKHIKKGEWYDIPYRSLVPLDLTNLIIGGRCISSTHEAHSAIRVMPIVFAIGQAAGVAAAQCSKASVMPKDLDVPMLQKELMRQGATLGDYKPE